MRFTDEQKAAIDMAAGGENFSLIAPAGSGKSSTVLGMCQALPRRLRILYLVYNTEARKEAENRFRLAGLDNVHVRTTSQLAWRAFADTHKERMSPGARAVPAKDVAAKLGLKEIDFGEGLVLDGYHQARLAADAVDRFCNSGDIRLTSHHVRVPVIGPGAGPVSAARECVARLAWAIWNQSIREDSNLRFTMNHAFKLLSVMKKDYYYDAVFVDEAQDSNDCTMKFLEAQKGSQIALIGDTAQAIYGWRGASDQIEKFDAPKLRLSQSFRFGEKIAEEAMKHLAYTETDVTIKGLPGIRDEVTDRVMEDPDVVLTRTNAGAMTYALSYLMEGKKVAMVKGTHQMLSTAYAASALMRGQRPRDLELSAFKNWKEVIEYSKEPGGGHLKAIVTLIGAYGVGRIIDACGKMTDYRQPHDVAVSTVHAVKGLEWEKVQIGDDFNEPEPFENPLTGAVEAGVVTPSDAKTHYVAVTRPQLVLSRGSLKFIDGYDRKEPDGENAHQ